MRKHTAFIRRYPNGTMDRLAGPPSIPGAPLPPKLASIDSDGLPRVGEIVKPDNVLVNREQPANTSDAVTNPDIPDSGFKQAALVFRGAEENVVDRVMISSTVADTMIVKVSASPLRDVVGRCKSALAPAAAGSNAPHASA